MDALSGRKAGTTRILTRSDTIAKFNVELDREQLRQVAAISAETKRPMWQVVAMALRAGLAEVRVKRKRKRAPGATIAHKSKRSAHASRPAPAAYHRRSVSELESVSEYVNQEFPEGNGLPPSLLAIFKAEYGYAVTNMSPSMFGPQT